MYNYICRVWYYKTARKNATTTTAATATATATATTTVWRRPFSRPFIIVPFSLLTFYGFQWSPETEKSTVNGTVERLGVRYTCVFDSPLNRLDSPPWFSGRKSNNLNGCVGKAKENFSFFEKLYPVKRLRFSSITRVVNFIGTHPKHRLTFPRRVGSPTDDWGDWFSPFWQTFFARTSAQKKIWFRPSASNCTKPRSQDLYPLNVNKIKICVYKKKKKNYYENRLRVFQTKCANRRWICASKNAVKRYGRPAACVKKKSRPWRSSREFLPTTCWAWKGLFRYVKKKKQFLF